MEQFSLDIGPTEKGDQNLDLILERVYMFINQLKSEGVQPYIF